VNAGRTEHRGARQEARRSPLTAPSAPASATVRATAAFQETGTARATDLDRPFDAVEKLTGLPGEPGRPEVTDRRGADVSG